jgi:hypothetical protein
LWQPKPKPKPKPDRLKPVLLALDIRFLFAYDGFALAPGESYDFCAIASHCGKTGLL